MYISEPHYDIYSIKKKSFFFFSFEFFMRTNKILIFMSTGYILVITIVC